MKYSALVALLLVLAVALPASAQAIFVELIRPQSDDLGHYINYADSGSYPILGAVASSLPVARVSIAGVPAVTFPLNYQVWGAPEGLIVTGFRARVFLDPTTPLRVTVVDEAGNFRDAAYLPDALAVQQRANTLLILAPMNQFNRLRAGNAQAMMGNFQLAMPELNGFVANNPDYGIGRHLRALALWDAGDWNGALADLQWLVADSPDAFPPRLDLAILQQQLGEYPAAVENYRYALNLRPDSAETHLRLGEALRYSGDLVQASLQQEAALEDDPTLAEASYEQGLINASQGDTGTALYNFRQAVVRNPRSAEAHMALAVMHYNRGRYRRAWEEVNRAVRWGAVPDPAFIEALERAHPSPYTPLGAPMNFQRPSG